MTAGMTVRKAIRPFLFATSAILASLSVHAQNAPPKSDPVMPIATPKVPTIIAPIVSAPKPLAYTTSNQKAVLIAPEFEDAAFKAATVSGYAVLLIFSGAADVIWAQQAQVLPALLKEAEFNKIPVFQIDATNAELMSRFAITVPGTLLLLKGGFERLRSTRMTKPEVIRKMLRLHGAL
jgi:hypothetical protein